MLRGGHGHADALSVVLSTAGQELLIDPGTGVYNCSPEWRGYFRSSRAHNTVVIDGMEQSTADGTFSWRYTARTRLRGQLTHREFDFVEGEHDGYSRLPEGVIHRRAVLHCRPRCWLVVDRFFGEGTHRFDLLYHLAPAAQVSLCSCAGEKTEMNVLARTPSAALRLFVCATTVPRPQLISGQKTAIQGWSSRRYGRREPAPTLQFSLDSAVPAMVLSILMPQPGAAESRLQEASIHQVEVKKGRALACSLGKVEHKDLWVAALDTTEIELQDYRMRGDLFWVRTYPDGRKQILALNALHLSCGNRELIPASATAQTFFSRWTSWDHTTELLEEGSLPCAESAA
jgi:hypothetical protein